MPGPLTIQLARRITGVRVLNTAGEARGGPAPMDSQEGLAATERIETAIQAERARMAAELERQKGRFSQSCQTVDAIAANLGKLYQDTMANNHADIVKLAVEIARKILKHKVSQGDYDIQAIVEESLKRAPTRQNIVIRLHPEDLGPCQRYQQENPGNPFAELVFTADWSVGRGECLVETPKGIVKSFIEEHLEHISEALQKVK
jgi:flagellar biosynthesis/type III secretory pathway protein FliH